MITEKKGWILALLYSNNKKPVESTVRLMKELFLIKQEIKKHDKISDREFYNFQPYLYGPCSFEVYKDLHKLRREGLIEVKKNPGSRWNTYRITKKGEENMQYVTENVPKIISSVKSKFNDMSFIELLKYVYNEYPKFARNSVMNLS